MTASLLLVSQCVCDEKNESVRQPEGKLLGGLRAKSAKVEPQTYPVSEIAVKQITEGTTTRIEKVAPEKKGMTEDSRLVITFQKPGDSVDLVIPAMTGRPHQLTLSLTGSPAGGVVDVSVAPRLIHWRHMASHPTVVDTHVDGGSFAIEVPLGAVIAHGQDDGTLTIQLRLGEPLDRNDKLRTQVIVNSVSVKPYEMADERAIVERVLAEKGEVTLWTQDERLLQRVSKIKDVPETEWILQKVRMGQSTAPECMIELLSRSQSLKELDAGWISRSRGEQKAVPLAPGWLQKLTMMPTLTVLQVNIDDWSAEDWSALEQLSQLTSLQLHGRNTADGRSMESVSKLKCLSSLSIDAPHVTPEQMAFLIDHPRLNSLFVHRATDANVKPLAALKHLRHLSLSCPDRDSIADLFGVSSKVTANYLQPITELPLERVSLFCGSQNPRLPDSILDPLTQIPTLQNVYVHESRFSPAAIERLKEKLPKTCQLNIAQPISGR